MSSVFNAVVALVFIVIIINFIMLYLRLRKDIPRKSGRKAPSEADAAIWREKEIYRRLEREQENLARCVELRNSTLALYEEVRLRHSNDDVEKGPIK